MKSILGPRIAAAIAAVCLALALPVFASAQYTTVSASNLGGTQTPVNGTIYWQPIIATRIGTSNGQMVSGMPSAATVTSGAFSLSLPDALQAAPNICYAVTAIDGTTGSVLFGAGLSAAGQVNFGGPYGCVQPTGATWNFDDYQPNSTPPSPLPANLFASPNVTTGSAGSSAAASISMLASGQYQLGFTVPGSATFSTGTVTALSPGATPTASVAGGPANYQLNVGLPASPSVSIGTVSTGAPGSSASVTNSGTAYAPVFNFSIPQGIPSLTGANGGAWASGTTYSQGAVVSYSGSSYASFIAGNVGHEPDTSPSDWGMLANLSNLPTAFASQSAANPSTGTFTSVAASTIVGQANPLPTGMKILFLGSSIGYGWNDVGDSYISASSAGTGYSGTGTVNVTVATGSCTTPPTISAVVNGSGGLTFALTYSGYCASPSTFTTAISGFTGGSGASVTLTQYPNPYANGLWTAWASSAAVSGKITSTANHSVAGYTVYDVTALFTGTYASGCGSGTYNWVVLDGGMFGNSLTGNEGESEAALTAAQTYNQWVVLYNAILAAGCHVIFTTPLNRGGDYSYTNAATYEAQIQILAPLVASSLQSGDYLLDWYNDLNSTSVYPFSQAAQTHFTGPGQITVANLVNAELIAGGRPKQYGLGIGNLNTLYVAFASTFNGAATFNSTATAAAGLMLGGAFPGYAASNLSCGVTGGTYYCVFAGPTSSTLMPVVFRQTDSTGSSIVDSFLALDASDNLTIKGATVSIGGSGFSSSAGFSTTGNDSTYVADALNIAYAGSTIYYTHTGSASTSRISVINRSCGSAAGDCQTLWSGDTSGNFGMGFCSTPGSGCYVYFDQNGVNHQNGTAPTASSGTVTGTNAGGSISGLSAAASVTLTFANSGWTSWASCPSLNTSTGTGAYPSAVSKTSVTITFASSFTGTLYYGCVGN